MITDGVTKSRKRYSHSHSQLVVIVVYNDISYINDYIWQLKEAITVLELRKLFYYVSRNFYMNECISKLNNIIQLKTIKRPKYRYKCLTKNHLKYH